MMSVVVTFPDVVGYESKIVRGQRVFDMDAMLSPPTKTFANDAAYQRWSRWVDGCITSSRHVYGRDYRLMCQEWGFEPVEKDRLLNTLRFGEKWCDRYLPQAHQRLCDGSKVPQTKYSLYYDMFDEEEDNRRGSQVPDSVAALS